MNLPACLITRWESLVAACAAAGAGAATTLLAMQAHELNDCSECNDCNERERNEWGAANIVVSISEPMSTASCLRL